MAKLQELELVGEYCHIAVDLQSIIIVHHIKEDFGRQVFRLITTSTSYEIRNVNMVWFTDKDMLTDPSNQILEVRRDIDMKGLSVKLTVKHDDGKIFRYTAVDIETNPDVRGTSFRAKGIGSPLTPGQIFRGKKMDGFNPIHEEGVEYKDIYHQVVDDIVYGIGEVTTHHQSSGFDTYLPTIVKHDLSEDSTIDLSVSSTQDIDLKHLAVHRGSVYVVGSQLKNGNRYGTFMKLTL